MMKPKNILAFASAAMIAVSLGTAAQAASSCQSVRFADVGWTDITATTAATSVVLKSIGYKPSAKVLSVPVTYKSLENKDIDIFLGNLKAVWV